MQFYRRLSESYLRVMLPDIMSDVAQALWTLCTRWTLGTLQFCWSKTWMCVFWAQRMVKRFCCNMVVVCGVFLLFFFSFWIFNFFFFVCVGYHLIVTKVKVFARSSVWLTQFFCKLLADCFISKKEEHMKIPQNI